MKYARLLGALSSILIVPSAISFVAVGIIALLALESLEAFFDTSIKELHSFGLIGAV